MRVQRHRRKRHNAIGQNAAFPLWTINANLWSQFQAALLALHSTQTDDVATFGSLSADDAKWVGGVLAPNGCIYGIPYNSTTVLKIDPVAETATTFGSLAGTFKWYGGVLAPNGCIYGIPFNSTTVLKIDPVAETATTFGSLSADEAKWVGGVLAPNGCIYGIPLNSTTVLKLLSAFAVDSNFPLSRYVNKF